jgi:hypothetical protein
MAILTFEIMTHQRILIVKWDFPDWPHLFCCHISRRWFNSMVVCSTGSHGRCWDNNFAVHKSKWICSFVHWFASTTTPYRHMNSVSESLFWTRNHEWFWVKSRLDILFPHSHLVTENGFSDYLWRDISHRARRACGDRYLRKTNQFNVVWADLSVPFGLSHQTIKLFESPINRSKSNVRTAHQSSRSTPVVAATDWACLTTQNPLDPNIALK